MSNKKDLSLIPKLRLGMEFLYFIETGFSLAIFALIPKLRLRMEFFYFIETGFSLAIAFPNRVWE